MSTSPDQRPHHDNAIALLEQVWGKHAPSATPSTVPDTGRHPTGQNWPAELGRYRTIRILGSGAYGVVLEAEDTVVGRAVALKIPRPEYVLDPIARARALDEARFAGRLEHPGIVRIWDAGETDGVWYIASELCDGPDLAAWLRTRNEPLPPRAAAASMAVVTRGIAAAHAGGIIHRDLKPSNILLVRPTPDAPGSSTGVLPGEWVPKVADFGLAKLVAGGVDRTRTGRAVGTPQYMAPEQAEGGEPVGPPADVWAVGVILYELLTGVPPFRGESVVETLRQVCDFEPPPPRRVRPGVPPDLDAVCVKCLDKDPGRRYPSAAALADDLDRFLADRPTLARPLGPIGRGAKWYRRNRRVAVLAGTLAATIVVGSVSSAVLAGYWRREAAVARTAEATADHERGRADDEAFDALLAEARAVRERGGSGQRVNSLTAVRKALAVLDRGHLSDPDDRRRAATTEYLSALLLPDLIVDQELPCPADGVSAHASLDTDFRHYAYGTGSIVHVRRVADGVIEQTIHCPAGIDGLAYPTLGSAGRRIAVMYDQAPGNSTHPSHPVVVWDIAGPAPRELFRTEAHHRRGVVFASSGEILAVSDRQGQIRVLKVPSGGVAEEYQIPRNPKYSKPVQAVHFHPTLPLIAAAAEGTVTVFDRITRIRIATLNHQLTTMPVVVNDFAWGNVPPYIVGWQYNSLGFDWEVFTGTRVGRMGWNRGSKPIGRISPAGDLGVTASETGILDLRSLPVGRRLVEAEAGTFGTIAFDPTGRRIGLEHAGDRFRIWRAVPEDCMRMYTSNGSGSNRLAVSPNGRFVALSEDRPSDPRLCDAETGRVLAYAAIPDCLREVQFSPDGRSLFSLCGALTVGQKRLVRLPIQPNGRFGPAETVATFPDPDEKQVRVTLALGGRYGWTISEGTATVFDTLHPAGTRFRVTNLPVGPNIAISPDGHYLAVGGESVPDVQVYTDDGSGEGVEITRVPAMTDPQVAFSPDGRSLAIHDGICRVWSTRTWQPGPVMPAPIRPTRVLPAFSPDGKWLACPDGGTGLDFVDTRTGSVSARLATPFAVTAVEWPRPGRWLTVKYGVGTVSTIDLARLRDEARSAGLAFPPAERSEVE